MPARTTVAAPGPQRAAPDDVYRRLQALPGVDAVERIPGATGYRSYLLTFRQPVDHHRPRGATFEQRVTVMHRDVDRPVSLGTSGYQVVPQGTPSEITTTIGGNQVAVEHRYFKLSRPEHLHWQRDLTIWQAAADVHTVVQSLQQLYGRPWISSGVSKGGMAATYHRRFFPDDVRATVAYSAPNDVVDERDAYAGFLRRVGSDACREALTAVQRRLLGEERDTFLALAEADPALADSTWTTIEGLPRGYEAAVVSATFGFWTMQGAAGCDDVPGPGESPGAVYRWLSRTSSLEYFDDDVLDYRLPYYHQALQQLGSPTPDEAPLSDLLLYPGAAATASRVPSYLKPVPYDASAMRDVDRWVRTRATRILFVYGSDDPWRAEPFSCGDRARSRGCGRAVVPGGVHGSLIGDLPAAKRRAVVRQLRVWAGQPTR